MMLLIWACFLTLSVSAVCSLLEAFVLSVSTAEIEQLKKNHTKQGQLLEEFKDKIDSTSSAILTLNTIANTAGMTWVGYLSATYTPDHIIAVSALMVVMILVLSEILPKNLGVAYRRELAPILVPLVRVVCFVMWPLAVIAKLPVQLFIQQNPKSEDDQQQEIILLAERSAKEGSLSRSERDLISNALSLDDIEVMDIMTPRTVVSFLEDTFTVGEICQNLKSIPFARIPVYHETIDNVIGLVRRRDILQASSEDRDHLSIKELMISIPFIPDQATALNALQLFLQKHQQLALVVDEYGSTAGVITMEDVIEHLLGREIYEETDVAVDMRELARKRAQNVPPLTEDRAKDNP
jgi:CBS domain containing-hemolysin-like protein